ncbi:hypothetical protein C8R44DRAFT_228533 [Mycena epipterygia]|nr:hypothetical protein C8R44DRAFT_228533 [Mycena epipterygia]
MNLPRFDFAIAPTAGTSASTTLCANNRYPQLAPGSSTSRPSLRHRWCSSRLSPYLSNSPQYARLRCQYASCDMPKATAPAASCARPPPHAYYDDRYELHQHPPHELHQHPHYAPPQHSGLRSYPILDTILSASMAPPIL